MNKNKYLVLHDFTPVGDAAFMYAINLSNNVSNEILLLHLVNNKSQVNEAEAKINKIIREVENLNLKAGKDTKITPFVRVGNIFEDVSKVVKEESVNLIVMGTHGAKGMQKVFGSFAMKVITSSDVPFIVIQKDTKVETVKKILVPIDLEKESLQIVNIAGDLANIFNAEIFLIAEKQEDQLLNRKIKNRILIVKKQYEERGISCNVEFISMSGSYQQKVLTYCREKEIDLIAIAYHTASFLPQFDKFAQTLITNEDMLPCAIVNSKLASSLYY